MLFLSHVYGAVLLLITPLIAAETLTSRLWPYSAVAHRTASQTVTDSDGRCVGEAEHKEEDNPDEDGEKSLSHAVSYLCCLSVWVVVALDVRWRWRWEEVWAAACLHTTNSLIRCLPNLFSPMSSTVSPCWVMAFLSLLLLLTLGTGLHRQRRAPAQMTQRQKHGGKEKGYACRQYLAPAQPVDPAMLISAAAQCVDPEKTESSCGVRRACSWNSTQMSARHHGDFILSSPGCFPVGQEHKRTKAGTPLTFITEDHVDSQHRSQCGWRPWGFPCLWVNVMIGISSVLFIFVLPLHLSVNIFLIRTIESLLDLCFKSWVSSAANTGNTHAETLA